MFGEISLRLHTSNTFVYHGSLVRCFFVFAVVVACVGTSLYEYFEIILMESKPSEQTKGLGANIGFKNKNSSWY